MASSIKTELAIEWKVDVVTKIFDACSSMHACISLLERDFNVSTMASLAIVNTLKSILITFFQFDVPSALTHVWSSKQLV
jgi:hypothetical protein